MNKRPDGQAVLGILAVAGLIVVGWIILSAIGHDVGANPWQVVAACIGAVAGWVGKSVWSDREQQPPEPPRPSDAPPVGQD